MSIDENCYETRVDFLPDYGWIFVDVSALCWVCPEEVGEDGFRKRDAKIESAKVTRLKKFNDLFAARGNVSSSPRVLRELSKKIGIYDGWAAWLKKGSGKYSVEHQIARKGARESSRAYTILKFYNFSPPNNATSLDEIKMYIEGRVGKRLYRKKFCNLSKPDIELVSHALFSGPGNGILTADFDMMDACISGAKKFEIDNFFISNAISCKTEYFGRS